MGEGNSASARTGDLGRRIADAALDRSLITSDQYKKVIEAHRETANLGMPQSIPELLVKMKLLSPKQVKECEAALRSLPRIAGYELVEQVGRGGMGTVFKARQVSMDRLVALKVLPPRLAKDKGFIERFLREARATAKLNHPNVVQGIDVGESNGLYYFAMEFVEGPPLREVLRREGRISPERTVEIGLQIASALEFAHKQSMVHRDIKPDNILIAPSGAAKLVDLGLARQTGFDAELYATESGKALGTPYYISPEQARAQPDIDIRSDLYSLGATLYHLVTGQTPFEGPTSTVVMTKHLVEQIPHPQKIRKDVPPGLAQIIAKLMAKDRDDRYQTPAALTEDFKLLQKGKAPKNAFLNPMKNPMQPFEARSHVRRAADGRSSDRAPEKAGGRERESAAKSPLPWLLLGVGLLAAGGVGGFLLLGPGSGQGDGGQRDKDVAAKTPADPGADPKRDPAPEKSPPAKDPGKLPIVDPKSPPADPKTAPPKDPPVPPPLPPQQIQSRFAFWRAQEARLVVAADWEKAVRNYEDMLRRCGTSPLKPEIEKALAEAKEKQRQAPQTEPLAPSAVKWEGNCQAWPVGYRNGGMASNSADPADLFRGKCVIFQKPKGKLERFHLTFPRKVSIVEFHCQANAVFDARFRLLDTGGKVLAQAGPYNQGNMRGPMAVTMPVKDCPAATEFVIETSSQPSDWYALANAGVLVRK